MRRWLTVLPFYILVNCKAFLQRQLPHVVEVVRPNHPVSVTVVLHLCALSELVHRTRYLSANLSLQQHSHSLESYVLYLYTETVEQTSEMSLDG